MVWRLRKCFCGFSLRSSCIATAIVLIVFCSAALISEISVVATDNRLSENEKIAAYVVMAVVIVIMLPSSILLLHGVLKNKERPVLVWFGATAALFIPQIVGMFLNIYEGFMVYMLTCCALAVELYMMALVYSYLLEQRELKRRMARAATSTQSAIACTSSAVLEVSLPPRCDVVDKAVPGPSRRVVEVVSHAPPSTPFTILEEEEAPGLAAGDTLHKST